jgi:hypothetical protein
MRPAPEFPSPARRAFGPARATPRTPLSPASLPGEVLPRPGPLS